MGCKVSVRKACVEGRNARSSDMGFLSRVRVNSWPIDENSFLEFSLESAL